MYYCIYGCKYVITMVEGYHYCGIEENDVVEAKGELSTNLRKPDVVGT